MSVQIQDARHFTVDLAASYDAVFDYLSDSSKVPEWVVDFITASRVIDGVVLVTTPMGEVPLEIEGDRSTGVIAMTFGGGDPTLSLLRRTAEGSAYDFLLAQPPGMPDAAWTGQGIPGMVHELEVLAGIVAERFAAAA